MTGAARAARGALALAALVAIASLAAACRRAEPPVAATVPVADAPADVDPSACLEDDGKCSEVERLRPECERGSGYACSGLGWSYSSGEGVRAPDPAAAVQAWEAACRFGEPYACANLAIIFSRGDGVPKNPARAFTLAVRACDGGAGHGCSLAGFLLFKGEGVEVDLARGVKLLERGCAKDDVTACCNFADALARGLGTPVDRPRAMRLAAALCEKSAEGCDTLYDVSTTSGASIEEFGEAAKLLRAACERGDEKACSRAEELERIVRKHAKKHRRPRTSRHVPLSPSSMCGLAKTCETRDELAAARRKRK